MARLGEFVGANGLRESDEEAKEFLFNFFFYRFFFLLISKKKKENGVVSVTLTAFHNWGLMKSCIDKN